MVSTYKQNVLYYITGDNKKTAGHKVRRRSKGRPLKRNLEV